MTIVLQFAPNGEFTHGYDSSKSRKSRVEKLQEKLGATKAPAIAKEICADIDHEVMSAQTFEGVEFSSKSALYTCLRRHDLIWMYAVEPFDESIEPYVVESEHNPIRYSYLVGAKFPIGLSDGTNFTKNQKTRKPCGGLTRSMARTIRNAGYMLEQLYGKDNLSFLTLTLPDLPEEGLQACAANWGRMVDQFLKWLRSVIEAKGGELDYTYCTEVQTKRLKTRGEYALHLHLLFGGREFKKHPWYVQPTKVRKAWVRCIKAVYPGSFTSTALENIQRVKKSAAGYIAKYVSKGTCDNAPKRNGDTISWFKGHWGGVSRCLRRCIREASIRISQGTCRGQIARDFIRAIPRLIDGGFVKYYCAGFIPTDRCENEAHRRGIHVGVGCLKTPTDKLGLLGIINAINVAHEQVMSNEL